MRTLLIVLAILTSFFLGELVSLIFLRQTEDGYHLGLSHRAEQANLVDPTTLPAAWPESFRARFDLRRARLLPVDSHFLLSQKEATRNFESFATGAQNCPAARLEYTGGSQTWWFRAQSWQAPRRKKSPPLPPDIRALLGYGPAGEDPPETPAPDQVARFLFPPEMIRQKPPPGWLVFSPGQPLGLRLRNPCSGESPRSAIQIPVRIYPRKGSATNSKSAQKSPGQSNERLARFYWQPMAPEATGPPIINESGVLSRIFTARLSRNSPGKVWRGQLVLPATLVPWLERGLELFWLGTAGLPKARAKTDPSPKAPSAPPEDITGPGALLFGEPETVDPSLPKNVPDPGQTPTTSAGEPGDLFSPPPEARLRTTDHYDHYIWQVDRPGYYHLEIDWSSHRGKTSRAWLAGRYWNLRQKGPGNTHISSSRLLAGGETVVLLFSGGKRGAAPLARRIRLFFHTAADASWSQATWARLWQGLNFD